MRTHDNLYFQAVLARDSRFDGRFFFGVKTTGVYCRPICPAKPKRENVVFFKNALSAEKAGYRPCLRCRPESAPSSPVWLGKHSTVRRALKLISSHQAWDRDENDFAELLGVSARHLRRLFVEEIGKTPKQVSDVHRIYFSKKLVEETQLSLTDVALSSGFDSVRRFNEVFRSVFGCVPSAFRHSKKTPCLEPVFRLRLPYQLPFDWAALLEFYRSHELTGVEKVSANRYERVFEFQGARGGFALSPDSSQSSLVLEIAISDVKWLFKSVQNIRCMFDLDTDPNQIQQVFLECSVLSALTQKYSGLRLPGAWDPFETSISVILGQLVSIEQARRMTEQLISEYGKSVVNPLSGQSAKLFPEVTVLARESLEKVGTTAARKGAIRELSQLVLDGKIRLDSFQDLSQFRKDLLQIKGIGPWTAEMICLRALRDTDAFPASDLILRQVLERNPALSVERFKPWQGYAALYLWKEYSKALSKKKTRSTRRCKAKL